MQKQKQNKATKTKKDLTNEINTKSKRTNVVNQKLIDVLNTFLFCFVSSSVKQINKYDITFLEIFHVTDDNKSPGFVGKSYEITNSFRNHKKTCE